MRRVMKVIAIIAIVGLALVSCGADDDGAGKQSEVSLKTVSMFGATDPALGTYNAMLEAFQIKYPHVTISDESSTSNEDWKARIKADFAVNNEPDVILWFTDANSHDLIENGSFVDIATIKESYPDFVDHIFPYAFTTAPDNIQYAVPTRGFYEALFCNKDLFDQYGLELPTDWAKLMTAVETFNANGVVPFAVSFADVPHYMIEHLVLAAGGIEDHKIMPSSSDDIPESWVQGMEQFKVLYDAGAFPVDVTATTDPLVSEMFYSKKAAMKLDGSWFMGGITDKDNVVAMPFPSMNQADSTDIIGGFTSGWYITKKGWEDESKRQILVDFVEEVSSPEFFAQITSVAPCVIPAAANMTILDQTGLDVLKSAKAMDNPIDSRISGEAWNAWVGSIGSLAEGEIDAKDMLTNVIDIYYEQ